MSLERHEGGIHVVSAIGVRPLRVIRVAIFRATLRPISVSGRARTAKLSGDARHAVPLSGDVSDYAHKFEIINSTRLANRRSGALGDQDIQARP